MIHLGVAEAHGQVEPTVAGGHHRASGQPLEGHVPQPAGVEPVGGPGVDREHHRGRLPPPVSSNRSKTAVQPAGFLASRSRRDRPRRWIEANRPATSSTAAIRASTARDGRRWSNRATRGDLPDPSINGAATATMAALARLN